MSTGTAILLSWLLVLLTIYEIAALTKAKTPLARGACIATFFAIGMGLFSIWSSHV